VKFVPSESEFPTLVFSSPEDVRRSGIVVTTLKQVDLDETVTANAVVGYDRSQVAQLSPRAAGRVAYVFRRLGDEVVKGEVLALIDSEEAGRAKADYLQEAAIAMHKAQILARMVGVGTDVVTERSLREAEAAAREAKLRMFAAHQRLLNLGITIDLTNDATLTPEEMAARLQYAGIPTDVLSKLDPKPRNANLIPLVTPLAGVITQQDTVVGEMERPDQQVITVTDVSKVWVWLSVRKEDAGRLSLGQRAEMDFDGRSTPVHGKLSWVSSEIDPKTRTLQARVDVENPQYQGPVAVADKGDVDEGQESDGFEPITPAASPRMLLANMFGSGRIRIARMEGALVIPDAAVQTLAVGEKALRKLVFVAGSDGVTFEPRVVRLGRSKDGMTHILEGLRPGDKIVVGGSFILKSELMRDAMSGGGG
jgi:cobalt-zinc-cadmium efflux system membrane fusion protein